MNGGVRASRDWPWSKRFAIRLYLTDAVAIFVAVVAGQLALLGAERFEVSFRGWSILVDPLVFYLTLALGWMAALELSSSRARDVIGLGVFEYRRVISASVVMFGSLIVAAFFFTSALSRGHLAFVFGVGLWALLMSRWLWRKWLVRQRRQGKFCSQVILLGSAESVASAANRLSQMPTAGKNVVGALVLDDPNKLGVNIAPFVDAIEDVQDVLSIMDKLNADTVILTSNEGIDPMKVRSLSWSLDPLRHQLMLIPGIADIGGPRISIHQVPEMHLIQIDIPEPTIGRKLVKRWFDIIFAIALLLMSLPVLAIAGIFIWREDRGPIIFKQERVGLYGNPFRLFKLRTMTIDAEAKLSMLLPKNEFSNGVLFKLRDDPRVTRVGKFLRRWSIDELPQLINVLIGSMSLVGPRPHLPSEVAEFEEHAHRRFLVKPGITGPWQVGGRSNLTWEEALRLDLNYVENWSIIGDLRILWRTGKAVITADGAY